MIKFKDYFNFLSEGILKLPDTVISQIDHEIIPGIRRLCVRNNLSNTAIVDMVQLLDDTNINKWFHEPGRGDKINFFYKTNLKITIPSREDPAAAEDVKVVLKVDDVSAIGDSLSRGSITSGFYDAENKTIIIHVACLLPMSDPRTQVIIIRKLDTYSLREKANEIQQMFLYRMIRDNRNPAIASIISSLKEFVGFKRIKTVIEHELIHAIDYTAKSLEAGRLNNVKMQDKIEEFVRRVTQRNRNITPSQAIHELQNALNNMSEKEVEIFFELTPEQQKKAMLFAKRRSQYSGRPRTTERGQAGYYRTPGVHAGSTPIEFNSNFWNIIREYNTPLSAQDKQELIAFIKNPGNAKEGLKNLPKKIEQYDNFIYYMIIHQNTRKKFLQRLGAWIAANS